MSQRPIPRHPAPELQISMSNGSSWQLSTQKPENFTMLIFYRGLHCPVCKKYLEELEGLLGEYRDRGVSVLAVSMDSESRARLTRQKWEIPNVSLGYGLSREAAENWGLFLSNGIKDKEPDLFSEPGLFLVDKENKVYSAAINSNPWGRPHLPSMLKAIDFILDNDYPARGEVK